MSKGIYAAASSMYADRFVVEVRANNMANAQSAGFRRAVPMRESFAELLRSRDPAGTGLPGQGAAGVRFAGAYTDFQNGHLTQTDDTFDAAIAGTGFYVLQDGERQLLTRHAHFLTDAQGLLQTDEGRPVLGQAGTIRIPPTASSIDIDQQGRIYALLPTEEGPQRTFLEQLRVVDVPDRQVLRPVNGQLFDPAGQVLRDSTDYIVRQGYLEEANVEPIDEMVEMVAAQRRYDAAQRVLNAQLEGGGYSEILGGV
ncbi:MAG: flagellar hook-basal body protein [Planctomycetota bacterium]